MKKNLVFLALAMWGATSFAQSAPTNTLTFDFQPSDVTTYGVTGFGVERKVEACAGTSAFAALATAPATGTVVSRTYVDSAITTGKVYCYRVRALAPVTTLNPSGNSGYSNTAEKTVPLPTMPAPQNLLITFLSAMIDALEQYKTALQQQ